MGKGTINVGKLVLEDVPRIEGGNRPENSTCFLATEKGSRYFWSTDTQWIFQAASAMEKEEWCRLLEQEGAENNCGKVVEMASYADRPPQKINHSRFTRPLPSLADVIHKRIEEEHYRGEIPDHLKSI